MNNKLYCFNLFIVSKCYVVLCCAAGSRGSLREQEALYFSCELSSDLRGERIELYGSSILFWLIGYPPWPHTCLLGVWSVLSGSALIWASIDPSQSAGSCGNLWGEERGEAEEDSPPQFCWQRTLVMDVEALWLWHFLKRKWNSIDAHLPSLNSLPSLSLSLSGIKYI